MMGTGMDMGEGVKRIGRERRRQIEEKGWTEEHDRTEHENGSLVDFATALLLEQMEYPEMSNEVVDAAPAWVESAVVHAVNKYREEPIRLLEIAGALIAAEIDRLTWVAAQPENG